MSKDVPKKEELNPEQSRDDVSEIKVTMNEPTEIEKFNPNSEQSRNVSLIKDLNPTVPELNSTVPLFIAQMMERGRRKVETEMVGRHGGRRQRKNRGGSNNVKTEVARR